MAKKRYYEGMYAGADARRSQEASDSGMISEDKSAIANLPQGVIMKAYPTVGYNSFEGLNDTLTGIDVQEKSDMKGKKSGGYPEKF